MQILSAKYLTSSPSLEKCPLADLPEYAFIGRSNVGKSSLINMLTDHNGLAKISNQPGKTQMINHFQITSTGADAGEPVTRWYLVDLPGYGFAKISQSDRRRWEQMTENYLRKRENLLAVFLLIDARHAPQKLDLAFVFKLEKWGVPYTLVFTKADKEKQSVVSTNVKGFLGELRTVLQFLPRHVVSSSLKKTGRNKLLDLIAEKNEDFLNAEDGRR